MSSSAQSHFPLCIPEKILDQHMVVLGKTGAGKSSALRHLVEHLLSRKKRVCIIDPKGDWWGLKSGKDGDSAGFPVIAFGDFKNPRASDVPINAQSGAHLAELITSGNRPAIIGFRGWMTSHMIQFWIDFAAGIFNANSGELFLVGDEFHNFAPKGKIMDPQAGKCLHWSNRLLAEGRGLGIVCLLASQRPQKVHNDTLTSCETLAAMRVVHAADRKAVEDWIQGCGDPAKGKEVLNALAGLSRGEAFVWSPEIKFGPERITFPLFQTFDSFAPPQLQKKISDRGWADVDLTAVKEKLEKVIETAKANDPAELKKQIAALQKELRAAQKPVINSAPLVTKTVEKFVLKDGQINQLDRLISRMGELWDKVQTHQEFLKTCARGITEAIDKTQNGSVHRSQDGDGRYPAGSDRSPDGDGRYPAKSSGRRPSNTSESVTNTPLTANPARDALSESEKDIVDAVASFPDGATRERIAAFSGRSLKSSTFKACLAEKENPETPSLIAKGLIKKTGDKFLITESGLSLARPTRGASLSDWAAKLSGSESSVLYCLAQHYPRRLSRQEVSASTGQPSTSSTFKAVFPQLRDLGLIEGKSDFCIVKSVMEDWERGAKAAKAPVADS